MSNLRRLLVIILVSAKKANKKSENPGLTQIAEESDIFADFFSPVSR